MVLKLYHPVESKFIRQGFGENWVCIKPDGTVFARTTPTCPAGSESIYKNFGMLGHNGLDYACWDWETVFCACEGVVTEVSTDRTSGLGITVVSKDKYEVSGGNYKVKTRYWHLAGMNVKAGDTVRVSDIMGWADNSGYSTGTHLHFDLKPVDDNGNNIFPSNGYLGAIDPVPYLQPYSAYQISGVIWKLRLAMSGILSSVADALINQTKDAYNK